MKIKWLIILSVILVGIILISFRITQQNNNIAALSEPVIPKIMQSIYSSLPPATTTAPSAPIVKSGITIITYPPKEPENIIPPAQVDKGVPTASNIASENNPSDTTTQGNVQAGITKIEKYPTPQKSQEMNSKGIVMY